MSDTLFNPPSFLDAESFSNPEITSFEQPNIETLDIFSDINWLGGNTSAQSSSSSRNRTQPITLENLPPLQQETLPIIQESRLLDQEVRFPEALRMQEPMTTDHSLKRDIIKYLYKNNQCGYLKTAISDENELEKLSDDVLYKKFRIGLVIDSVLGRNSSDKNLASYVFTFFETLLDEAQKLSSPEYKKYFEVFSLSLKKEKVLVLSESSSSTIASVLAANDIDSFLQKYVSCDTPSIRALKCSIQNISLLVSLTLTKKLLSPLLSTFINSDDTYEPSAKKQKTQ